MECLNLSIRKLALSDTENLLSFYTNMPESVSWFYRPFAPIDRQTMENHLCEAEAGGCVSLGIVDDMGCIWGHCLIFQVKQARPVFGIGLSPDIHGQGWGRRIAEEILRIADDMKLPLVTLTVMKTNEKARKLYESLGFVITGQCKFRDVDDSWEMERKKPE